MLRLNIDVAPKKGDTMKIERVERVLVNKKIGEDIMIDIKREIKELEILHKRIENLLKNSEDEY